MLSKNKIKLIRLLRNKKNRLKNGVFIAEGDKVVAELLGANNVYKIQEIYATRAWLEKWKEACRNVTNIIEVSDEELKKISLLSTPNNVLAVTSIPEIIFEEQALRDNLCICLDNLQDPGNLGTVLRIADWFGINNIFCGQDTVDLYNPKVVQASMGSFSRVNVHYVDLEIFLKTYPQKLNVPVFGTVLDGNDVNGIEGTRNGFILMGNESKGINNTMLALVDHKITIPTYPSGHKSADSLNVAVATGIICAAFRRQHVIQNALKKG